MARTAIRSVRNIDGMTAMPCPVSASARSACDAAFDEHGRLDARETAGCIEDRAGRKARVRRQQGMPGELANIDRVVARDVERWSARRHHVKVATNPA